MNINLTKIASLIMATFAAGSVLATAAPAATPTALVFNDTQPNNDLVGSLAARVQFAQSHILPAHPKEGENHPRLTSLRKSLLLVQPLVADGETPMQLDVQDANGKLLGSVTMTAPSALPKTVFHLPNAPDGDFAFVPENDTSLLLTGQEVMNKLNDPAGTFLISQLANVALGEIQLHNYRWTNDIYLPASPELEGKMVAITNDAYNASYIHYRGQRMKTTRHETVKFKFANGQWLREGDLVNDPLKYAEGTWSTSLPAEWILPGVRFTLRQGELSGELANVNVGAPNELLMHTIDIGMLTTPRNAFAFATDADAPREYFQYIPASRMIVSRYAPLHLAEVMLPNGTLLTDFDPSEGGWHGGTMRQRIGKELVSIGINNANYGINSTAGEGEGGHPYLAAQLTAHNSRGKYVNGVRVHGGSGGGGIVTLDSSLGNEFSHEVGHNYGLGHYVDGFRGSVHRSAEQINSTWGWDGDKNLFIPNFFSSRTNQDSCLDGECQSPFDGRPFGYDAMAGGQPMSNATRFTLYTPNSARLIQSFLEKKAVFDSKSVTGFSKWNSLTNQMEAFQHKIDSVEQGNAPMGDLSEAKMAALIAQYAVLNINTRDGHWTKYFYVPAASSDNAGRVINLDLNAGYNSHLFINGREIVVGRGYKKSFTSDGHKWIEGPIADNKVERKPDQFGIPVTTLVGYYDPQNELPSYVYQALHGAYGFTYQDDSATLLTGDCQLQVATREGQLNFKLANNRANSNVMNKFHINIPTASEPTHARVQCNGELLTQKPLLAPQQDLAVTVVGQPLEVENLAPEVTVPSELTVLGGEWSTVKAQGSDPEGQALSYQWHLPAGWEANETNGATLNVLTPVVTVSEQHVVTVTVSDGVNPVDASVTITLTPAVSGGDSCQTTDPEAGNVAPWNNSQVYQGAETVSHNQLVWRAKYWTQGNEPSRAADQWSLVSDVQLGWTADVTYNGGDTTKHNGRQWQAKWWTQGNEPGQHDVWVDIGAATCQ